MLHNLLSWSQLVVHWLMIPSLVIWSSIKHLESVHRVSCSWSLVEAPLLLLRSHLITICFVNFHLLFIEAGLIVLRRAFRKLLHRLTLQLLILGMFRKDSHFLVDSSELFFILLIDLVLLVYRELGARDLRFDARLNIFHFWNSNHVVWLSKVGLVTHTVLLGRRFINLDVSSASWYSIIEYLR